jgi:hypothetical protein
MFRLVEVPLLQGDARQDAQVIPGEEVLVEPEALCVGVSLPGRLGRFI